MEFGIRVSLFSSFVFCLLCSMATERHTYIERGRETQGGGGGGGGRSLHLGLLMCVAMEIYLGMY